jgi:NADH dehydrogenase
LLKLDSLKKIWEPVAQTLEPDKKLPVGKRPRVVVIGTGFGGLNVVHGLAEQEVEVIVIDRNNYHGFWPLLYQVATAELVPDAIAFPAREVIHKYKNLKFYMDEVTGIDLEKKQVQVTEGEPVSYDYLILAAGSANNYFGNKDLPKHTYSLKDIDQAVELRQGLLSAFERAVLEPDEKQRAKLLTFVIVGAGPTGVELAGAMAELIRPIIHKDYPTLNENQVRIVLVEAHSSALDQFPPKLQQHAQKRLQKMGVEIRQNSKVAKVENGLITFDGGATMEAATVVWAAGVRASELAENLGIKLAHSGRVPVQPTLNLKEHPEVFVVGDMAYLEGYKGHEAYPMVAQVAIQQGRQAAQNVLAQVRQQPLQPFHYFDKGTMATLGRNDAVVDAFGVQLNGLIGWFIWLVVHIYFLLGIRNRVLVMLAWAYNYLTYRQGVRLIGRQHPEPRAEAVNQ